MVQTNIGSTDRIRWGPIWAGIFAAISTMILLGLLGVAIGLSVYDAAGTTERFGMGAGIWQLITVIVAFFVGGWVAGRSSGFQARRVGWLNGALVWAVAIPLALLLLSSGAGAVMGGLGALTQSVGHPRSTTYDAQPAGGRIDEQMQESTQGPPNREVAVNRAQGVAWWTFASFALGLAAAAGGGSAGIRSREDLLTHDTTRPGVATV